jgi:hypothetical protein
MKVLVPLALFAFLGFAFWMLTRSTTEKRLSRPEKRELESLRVLRDDLYDQAAQHVALGDNFASIVMDTIRQQKRELK